MKLTVLGASPAVPGPGGASSGYLLESGQTTLLLDCGHGVTSVLQTVTTIPQLDAILISHMHPDHFFDLVPLRYAYFFQEISSVPLLLPPSGLQTLGRLQQAVGLANDFFQSMFDVSEYDPGAQLTGLPDLAVDFAPTQHFISGYAMRFRGRQDRGRELAYSSDTALTEEILALFQGASVGLVEATLLERERGDEQPGHMTAAEAGRLGREAGLDTLILTHYWTELREELSAEAGAAFGRGVEMAQERKCYEL